MQLQVFSFYPGIAFLPLYHGVTQVGGIRPLLLLVWFCVTHYFCWMFDGPWCDSKFIISSIYKIACVGDESKFVLAPYHPRAKHVSKYRVCIQVERSAIPEVQMWAVLVKVTHALKLICARWLIYTRHLTQRNSCYKASANAFNRHNLLGIRGK